MIDIGQARSDELKQSLIVWPFFVPDGKAKKMDKIILNTRDAAKFLTVSPGTLQNWRSQKFNLPFHKLGGRVIYFRDELERFARGGEIKVVRGQKGKR